jgi:hypothetical protein
MSYSSSSGGAKVRIYKLNAFARFQRRERISDASLVNAIRSAEDGLVDADLGGRLIKQRIARAGQGKSGGYRTVIAFQRGERAVFFFGFAKNERSNIDSDELEEFRHLAHVYLQLSANKIAALIEDNELMEVNNDEAD